MMMKPKIFHKFALVVDSGSGQFISFGLISIIGIFFPDGIVQVMFVESSIVSLLFSQSFIQMFSQLHRKEFPASWRLVREEIF